TGTAGRNVFEAAEGTHAMPSGERLGEVRQQVIAVLDADGKAHHGVGYAHRGPAFGAHLPVDGVCHGNGQGTGITQIAGADDEFQAIEKVQAVDAFLQVDAHDCTELA